MFIAVQYNIVSTEYGNEKYQKTFYFQIYIWLIFFIDFLSILDHFQVIKKIVKKWFWTTKL